MFKQVDQNYNAFSEGWPKAIRPIRNSVNTGPTVFTNLQNKRDSV